MAENGFRNAWEKLKREWKTFTIAVAGAAYFFLEAAKTQGIDLITFFPDQMKAWAGLGLFALMLILRKYTDPVTEAVGEKIDEIKEDIKETLD